MKGDVNMTIVFVSNFFNHHQKFLADAMYDLIGDDYYFIETEPISEERLNMGWGGDSKPSYVKQNYINDSSREECQSIINEADVVIHGSALYSLLTDRLKRGKLTFKYSERIYKGGCPYHKLPRHFILNSIKYRRYKNFYILCASAYTSADFAKTFTFLKKAYKWGYFTEVKRYEDINALIGSKQKASILWVARLIGWKHPEIAVEVARKLKRDGYIFNMNLIGNGELEENIRSMIDEYDIGDCVHMLGAMRPEQVREHMEKSEIFLFTSDRNEGWGAVLNESMNSACAVVASHAIGSVPFLIKNGENGLVYEDGDVDELYTKIKYLLDCPNERKKISDMAYQTMINEWNAENAAKRFIKICEKILDSDKSPFPYLDGVCSKAKVLKDHWYKNN